MILSDFKHTFLRLKKRYLLNIAVIVWLPILYLITESLNYLNLDSCKSISNFNSISKVLFLLSFVLVGCIAFFFLVVGFLNKSSRIKYWSRAVVFGLGFLFCFPAIRLSYMLRMMEMGKAAIIATPLINAIDNYKFQTSEYPKDLDVLVPAYIEKIPHTGMCAYPHFEYRRPKNVRSNDEYELFIRTSIGVLNWDEFIYRPSGEYGDSFEKIGRWAYYHE